MQIKQEEIEQKLSYRFNWYSWILVFVTSINTFFVIFHKYDEDDSEKTLRYKLGYIFYMVNFYIQCFLLLGTSVYAFIIYYRLAVFLKPPSVAYDDQSADQVSSQNHPDDNYIDEKQLDPFQ